MSDVSHSGTRRTASGDLNEWSVRIAGAALAARALESVVREAARLEAEVVATLSSELDVAKRSVEMRAGKKTAVASAYEWRDRRLEAHGIFGMPATARPHLSGAGGDTRHPS